MRRGKDRAWERPRAESPPRSGPHPPPHLHVGVLLRGQVKDPPGVVVQALQQVVQAEPALAHSRQQQRQHGLQPGEAGGRLGPTLLLQGVGGWGKSRPSAPPPPPLGPTPCQDCGLPPALLFSGDRKTGKREFTFSAPPYPWSLGHHFTYLLVHPSLNVYQAPPTHQALYEGLGYYTDQAPIPAGQEARGRPSHRGPRRSSR